MRKSFIAAAALVLILLPLSTEAQTAENAEFQYLSIDIGYAPGWSLAATGGGQKMPALFGLNIRVSDKLSAGIQTLTESATVSDNFLLLKYTFLPKVRATLGFGVQGADPASSVGFEVIPLSRSVGGLAATEFKAAVKYNAPFNDLTKGKILFALAFGIGF
ncbi:MAG: hypothetical protein LBP20_04400 [Treponema sp.]|nr:hypothetical protein [Treponema sp.]